jgi:hypothetical protein
LVAIIHYDSSFFGQPHTKPINAPYAVLFNGELVIAHVPLLQPIRV